MTDTPGTRIETDLDRIRREAFEKEARALKEAALQHFKDQTSAELNGLKTVLAAEIKTAVTAAMSDQAVKEALRKELTEQVLGKVAADLAKQIGDRIEKEVGQAEVRVVEKVRKELLESWTKAAKKALDDGLKSARADLARDQGGRLRLSLPWSREETASDQEEVTVVDTPPEAVAPPADPTPTGEPTQVPPALQKKEAKKPKEPSKPKKPFWDRLLDQDKLIAALLIVAFFLAVYMIWVILKSVSKRESTAASTSAVTTVTQRETPPPPAELSVTAQRIRDDWMRVVMAAEDQLSPETALPGLLAKYPFNKQVLCWFSDDAQKELENLARDPLSHDFQQQLDDALTPCFSEDPPLRDPMLAIFSAQATVANAFSRYGPEWDSWCAIANEATPPSLAVDGVAGTKTLAGINLFLQCTGHSGELTIAADSTTPQYLYVTYLALRELQR